MAPHVLNTSRQHQEEGNQEATQLTGAAGAEALDQWVAQELEDLLVTPWFRFRT